MIQQPPGWLPAGKSELVKIPDENMGAQQNGCLHLDPARLLQLSSSAYKKETAHGCFTFGPSPF